MPKRDYFHLYIVMVKPVGQKIYKPYKAGRGGLEIVAHELKKDAQLEARQARYDFGKRRVYVQMIGAIS